MNGEPVWLASASYRRGVEILGTSDWQPRHFRRAEKVVTQGLAGVGDSDRQRAFRMNITFCVHRALTDGEKARLPASFLEGPGGGAGPPVEVLWSCGIEHSLASMPCENPGHREVIPERPDLWLPESCGSCAVCLAREMALGVVLIPNRERITHDSEPSDRVARSCQDSSR